MSALLEVSALRVTLAGRRAVDGASLKVRPGELVGLIGPNGAGKSTLMRACLGLVPSEGVVRLGGLELSRLSSRERARAAAFLPQEREIGWPISVAVLVALGRAPHRRLGGPSATDQAAVAAAMARAEVAHLADRPATELSGGERARVLIARALAQDAPLLVADEPAAGLDPAHQIGLMEVLRGLAREGRGALVSLHELGLAAGFCDRLVVMEAGRTVAEGAPEAVLTPELLARVYGVRAHVARTAEGLIAVPVARLPGGAALREGGSGGGASG